MDLPQLEQAIQDGAAQVETCRSAYSAAVAMVANSRRAPEFVHLREARYAALATAITVLERAKRRLQRQCPACRAALERGDWRGWCAAHAWAGDLV